METSKKKFFFITKKINKIKRHTLKISIGTAHHCVVVDLLWCWPYYSSYENTEITLLCDNKESCNRCLPTTIINHYFYPLIWNTEWYTTKKSNNNNKKQSCPKSMILNSKKRSKKNYFNSNCHHRVCLFELYREKNPAHFNGEKNGQSMIIIIIKWNKKFTHINWFDIFQLSLKLFFRLF